MQNPWSSWTSRNNSVDNHIKVSSNAFDLDLHRLASSNKNNTFFDIADYTLLYFSSIMTDFNHISHEYTFCMIIIIMIIIMNFYSPVSNTRCHSIGHKMRIARIKIRVDSPGRWERA